MKKRSIHERFSEKIAHEPNTGCWLWTGHLSDDGYGYFNMPDGKQKSHRASYKIHKGEVIGVLEVCHSCDVRCCVNPDHLFLASHKENMMDMSRKGRAGRPSKLGLLKVNEIKAKYATGDFTQSEIAREYGVASVTVCRIVNGRRWNI